MQRGSRVWGLILAAGDGKRLQSLTTPRGGTAIPKQYCSLRGGASLLHEALQRAMPVATLERTCVVVAENHRCWWTPQLKRLAAANVIVQPENRGTAMGILLPLLHLLERDPGARLVILPADHYVRRESCLARSMLAALEALPATAEQTLLLGVTPEAPELLESGRAARALRGRGRAARAYHAGRIIWRRAASTPASEAR